MSSTANHFSAEPNLTPLLDLVFQLIAFFMLVINFKSAAIDPNIQLPVIGSARPIAVDGQGEVIVLNIDANGAVNVCGERQDVDQYLAREAELGLRLAGHKEPVLHIGDELPTAVVIRADKATAFTTVNQTLQACQRYGFHRVSLKVLGDESTQQF